MNNPEEYENHSGGALGSDKAWDSIGREFGVENHKHWRPEDIQDLSVEDYNAMLEDVYSAAQALDRPSVFRGVELVWRNWLPVRNAEAIYAIGRIIEPVARDFKGFINKTGKQIVAGGTGWAVEMAIQKGKDVYVFDMVRNCWFLWFAPLTEFLARDAVPVLTKKFAGIGSREITAAGLQAIRDVYTKAFRAPAA